MLSIGFFGAAGEVTGSCTIVRSERARVMVDMGLHQGEREADEHNRRMPPEIDRLDAVVLTHAHLDHCGRLPMLLKHGFRGSIFATPATIQLAAIILRDSASLQQDDADRDTRRSLAQGGKPVTPLYTEQEVEAVLRRFAAVDYGRPTPVAPGFTLEFEDAGHILGSASAALAVEHAQGPRLETTRVLFSGDIGVPGSPILRDPTLFKAANVVIMESTYGDRDHRPLLDTRRELLDVIRRAQSGGGKIIIPAFAIGRTQDIIYHLGSFLREGSLRSLDVYVDSPMATDASDLYRQHVNLYDCEARTLLNAGQNPLKFPGLHYVRTVEESKALNNRDHGLIVIAASGMCTGGRVLHHLKYGLPKPETQVVFVGFQGQGTLGRRLVERQPLVRIHGEEVPVRAAIHTLGGFSAHAGRTQLVQWAASVAPSRPRLFLTHGEDKPRRALADAVVPLGLKAELPVYGQTYEL